MNYSALITAIAAAHQQAQAGAAGAVNRHLILRNWLIGAHLVEFEQHGEDRAQYGTRLLQRPPTCVSAMCPVPALTCWSACDSYTFTIRSWRTGFPHHR